MVKKHKDHCSTPSITNLSLRSLDQSGEICRINMSQPQRDSYFSVPADEVHSWYAALAAYHSLLTDPKYCIQFKMEPGRAETLELSLNVTY